MSGLTKDHSVATVTLSRRSRFRRGIFEMGGDLGQRCCHAIQCGGIEVIQKPTSNAGEVNWPRRLQLGHAARGESRHVAPSVSETRGLRHESATLEFVDDASHTAGRQASRAGQIRHA